MFKKVQKRSGEILSFPDIFKTSSHPSTWFSALHFGTLYSCILEHCIPHMFQFCWNVPICPAHLCHLCPLSPPPLLDSHSRQGRLSAERGVRTIDLLWGGWRYRKHRFKLFSVTQPCESNAVARLTLPRPPDISVHPRVGTWEPGRTWEEVLFYSDMRCRKYANLKGMYFEK